MNKDTMADIINGKRFIPKPELPLQVQIDNLSDRKQRAYERLDNNEMSDEQYWELWHNLTAQQNALRDRQTTKEK